MARRNALGAEIAKLHRNTRLAAMDVREGWKGKRLFGRPARETVVKLARRGDKEALGAFAVARGVAEAYLWIAAGHGAEKPKTWEVDVALRRHGASFVRLHQLVQEVKIPLVLYLRIHALRRGGTLPLPGYLTMGSAVNEFSDWVSGEAAERYPVMDDLVEFLREMSDLGDGRTGADEAVEFRTRYLAGRNLVASLEAATGMPHDLVVALEMHSLPAEYLAADAVGARLVSAGSAPPDVVAAVNDFALRVETGPVALREAFAWAVRQ